MDKKGIIGEFQEDGYPVVMKFVDELPPEEVQSKYRWLMVISWRYDGSGQNGMPAADDLKRMRELEGAIERDLAEQGSCLHAYSRTGNSLKEFVYYIMERDEFMARFNKVLHGHPRYPIEIDFYEDENWQDFKMILERFKLKGR